MDIADYINVARYLAERGDIDGDAVAITGGSAGGYTTLYALCFHDFFATGASFFGVTDLVAFNETTHKFESQYDDWLIGPYPADDGAVPGTLTGPPRRRSAGAGAPPAGA